MSSFPSLPSAVRLIALSLTAAAFVFTGCQSQQLTVTVPTVTRFRVKDMTASPLDIDRALNEHAEAFAKLRPYAQTWRGAGLSMQPLIPPDAWIVTETIPFEALERGQVVLFAKTHGRRVAHALVRKTREGWITAGVNNRQLADTTRVTRHNYIGIVTAAFVAEL